MKPIVDEIAKRLQNELKDNIDDFEGLYVFGSQVRGDATENSDVDIIVLFKEHRLFQPDVFYEILSQMGFDYYDKIFLDVLPYTRKQLQNNYIFHDEVVNKGIYYGTWWVYWYFSTSKHW